MDPLTGRSREHHQHGQQQQDAHSASPGHGQGHGGQSYATDYANSNHSAPVTPPPPTGGPSDDDVLASLAAQRTVVATTLTDRLTHLKLLSKFWSSGDVVGAVGHLESIGTMVGDHDMVLAIVTDFLGRADLACDQMTLELAQRIFPLLDSLMFTSSGPMEAAAAQAAPNGALALTKPRRAHVAVKSATQLISMFGRLIVDVLSVDPQKVDLGLEERQRRCRACRDCIVSIHGVVMRIQHAAAQLHRERRRSQRPGSAGPSLTHSLSDSIDIFRGTYDGTFPRS